MSTIRIPVILGPTASGKSDLAVHIAKEINGEIISADSRQIYKGLDIGTGKITQTEMQGIPHHLLDIRSPDQKYSVAEWVKDATAAIYDIAGRGKVPIICGGTGFYISALVDGIVLPEVPTNLDFRKEIEPISTQELHERLEQLDPDRAANVDPDNRRRVERALEIATELGKVPRVVSQPNPDFEFIQIGITTSDIELKERIIKRLIARTDAGMIEEAERLHAQGLSFERMRELGLEYRYLADLLEQKITKEQFVGILAPKIWQYARRQKAWWRRDQRIKWYTRTDTELILREVKVFLS